MSVAKVVRLDQFRDRRNQRLRLVEALYRPDAKRRAVLAHLVEIAELSGADRVATVWLEEYGDGIIHPHVVLDLSSDRPRRAFSPNPLREAWELGVPGAHDDAGLSVARLVTTTLAVSLGSDGARAWFLVAESGHARTSLDARARDRIMFLAGECAAIVLHRDLDLAAAGGASASTVSFPGWRILEDLEGRQSDDAESRRIAQRFIVGRLARMLVEEGLALPTNRVGERVRRARAELGADPPADDPEVQQWHRVLDALEHGCHEELAATLVSLGDTVEAMGHGHGALELYRCAYEIAAAIGDARNAVDAARLAGRLLRRRADWEEARSWFEAAHGIATAVGMHDAAAKAFVGLAGIKKEMGNLPAAREGLRHALALAEASGDPDTIALAHHAFLGVEHAAGDYERALHHGWVAAATYRDPKGRVRCLASLGGVLADYGDRKSAEDAWSVVAAVATERYYQVLAHDALAYLAALRGDVEAFEHHARVCDLLGWEESSHSVKAEILYYRGLSHRALGRVELAREWLTRARTFAEEHKYHQAAFRAEAALKELGANDRDRVPSPAPAAPHEVREGLRAMRRELAGAAF
jgi:tetratricopeptide (TPR) repeat protein